jgi:hypothetical protein
MTITKIKRLLFKEYCNLDLYKTIIINNINNLSDNLSEDYWDFKFKKYTNLYYNSKQIINTTILGYNNISSNINYYLDRGYTQKQASLLLSKKQSTNTIVSIIKKNNCTFDEALIIFNKRQQLGLNTLKNRNDYDTIKNLRGNSNRYTYYLNKINPITNKKYTVLEAKQFIFNKQSNSAKSFWLKVKSGERKYISSWSYEYYLKQGLSYEDAKQERLKRGLINSLELYILKYGKIKGTLLFEKRRTKWLNTLNLKTDDEKLEILRKKTRRSLFYSNVAFIFFNKLDEIISDLNLKSYYGPNEYYIYNKERKILRYYDYTIPELNIIIEYNGSHCHVNKLKLTDNEFINWINPYNKASAIETIQYDMIKLNIAKELGFNLHVIWDTDCVEQKLNEFKKIITDEYNKKRNY